jgi:hypothetical protein
LPLDIGKDKPTAFSTEITEFVYLISPKLMMPSLFSLSDQTLESKVKIRFEFGASISHRGRLAGILLPALMRWLLNTGGHFGE